MNEEMKKQFADFYKNQDKNVFTDNMNPDETTTKISHLGFDSISDFDIAIKELKSDLKDFDTLLEDYQNQIIEVTTKQDFFQKHPEKDFTNKIEKLIEQEKEIMEQVEKIKERKQKQLKNLEELEVARKEFMNNKKNTYHEEIKERVGITAEPDANGKIDPKGKYGSIESSVFGQLERAKKELKDLEVKIRSGQESEIDKQRYIVVRTEIIPELENKLSNQIKEQKPVEEVEQESVEIPEQESVEEVEQESVEIPEQEQNDSINVNSPNLNDSYGLDGKPLTQASSTVSTITRKMVSAITNASAFLKEKITTRWRKNYPKASDIKHEEQITEEEALKVINPQVAEPVIKPQTNQITEEEALKVINPQVVEPVIEPQTNQITDEEALKVINQTNEANRQR